MTGGTPKYRILVKWVKSRISNRELLPGDKLNSENELSARFGMSRQTVRHAIDILEQEGIIERRQGSGSYITNFPFKNSHSSGTKNIAIISTFIGAYIFPSTIESMEKVLTEAGYTIQIAFTHNRAANERTVIRRILESNNIDGLIIEPTRSAIPNPNLDIYRSIRQKGIPMLFFNSYYPDMDIPHVSLNDVQAGYVATKRLIEAGHHHIGGIFKSDDGQGHRRYAGYIQCIIEHGLELEEKHILWIDTLDQENMVNDDKRVLKRIKNCTACVCYNDTVASDFEKICVKHGIRIPEDMSVTSVDNSELAEFCIVPLTSVAHPMGRLGKKAAENLIRMIKEPEFDGNYEFDAVLKERDSVKTMGGKDTEKGKEQNHEQ